MKTITFATVLVSITWLLAGCASKGYVDNSLERHAAVVEKRVTAVEQDLGAATDQTARNTARLDEVDDTATTAADRAALAGRSADHAQATASDAIRRARSLEAASRRLLFTVVISEDQGQFGFADATLPESATARLDALVEQLHAYPTSVHLEVEGHTDAAGSEVYNRRLGLARAESVKRYLYEHHQLPLHKIDVFSFGEERPIAPNDSIDGRAKNRRVVVRVLGDDGTSLESVATGADQQ